MPNTALSATEVSFFVARLTARDLEFVVDALHARHTLGFRSNLVFLLGTIHGAAQRHDTVRSDDLHVVGLRRESVVRDDRFANSLSNRQVRLAVGLVPGCLCTLLSVTNVLSRVVSWVVCGASRRSP